ncbi:heparan-alpha-glucosaminide N-acetyltransferase domain-containing protein [Kitasatospora atroaurantiaca]|uniref:Uncharacterized protein DUF418 n=1 Tax=Kitasatospora atroaurantiaca TaxID=285545 RepID=A0A561F1X4_9ACTN|nr:uncharacterized protein DUF418 [Kitasatospora atroaurantiaca]
MGPHGPGAVGRLVAVDAARGLAVFGMFAAHVGPDPEVGGAVGAAMQLAHGRASALFALLAGLALVLIAGRRPKAGRDGRQALARIVIRAVVLLAMGLALSRIGSPVEPILAAYGVYFLLALPLLRLPAQWLAGTAAAWAVLGPQLSFAARVAGVGEDGTWLSELLLTGLYPAATWMPYVLAGMALGRLDLAAGAVRRRLAAVGAGLAVLGYGTSWIALRVLGAEQPSEGEGTVAIDDPVGLLGAAPHTGSTFEILGNLGCAGLVLVACGALAERFGPRAAAPLATVGAVSLSAYVGHIALIVLLDIELVPGPPLRVLAAFVAGTLLSAWLWAGRFRRGPLETLVHRATLAARYVR